MDSLHTRQAGLMSLHEVILSEDTGPGPRPPHREHGGNPGLPGLEVLLHLRHPPLVPAGLRIWERYNPVLLDTILSARNWSCGAKFWRTVQWINLNFVWLHLFVDNIEENNNLDKKLRNGIFVRFESRLIIVSRNYNCRDIW